MVGATGAADHSGKHPKHETPYHALVDVCSGSSIIRHDFGVKSRCSERVRRDLLAEMSNGSLAQLVHLSDLSQRGPRTPLQ